MHRSVCTQLYEGSWKETDELPSNECYTLQRAREAVQLDAVGTLEYAIGLQTTDVWPLYYFSSLDTVPGHLAEQL